jgi:hypothetical protein
VSGSTLEWWMQQDEKARQLFGSSNKSFLAVALQQVAMFIGRVADDLAAQITAITQQDIGEHIRAKSASEIVDMTAASALLGHTEKDITERVYRRIGQAVSPTR